MVSKVCLLPSLSPQLVVCPFLPALFSRTIPSSPRRSPPPLRFRSLRTYKRSLLLLRPKVAVSQGQVEADEVVDSKILQYCSIDKKEKKSVGEMEQEFLQALQDPPERPRGHKANNLIEDGFQLWRNIGESCPEETIPIRRTREEDILRASTVQRFGRKRVSRFRRDSESSGHEHAVGYVSGDQYYGAKASLNVWAPKVTTLSEFSLSQIWVISGSFGEDLNTIEAGWQISPQLYGDNFPRFFTYWTTDAYQATGCYNLLCSGFIQTNNRIAIGAAIHPSSAYDGGQFDISILVWKQQGSNIVQEGPRCSLHTKKVYSDLTADYFKMFLLNVPAVVIAPTLFFFLDDLTGFEITYLLEASSLLQ